MRGIESIAGASRERAGDRGATLKRLLSELGPHRGGLVLAFVLIVVGAGAQAGGPYLIGRAIDRHILGNDPSGLYRTMVLLLVTYVAGTLAQSGQIRQVVGNSYKEDLVSGDALAVIGWSGDITQINFESGDKWEFAIPDSGGTLWSDNVMVPIGSPHKTNAERLINYYYDPEVAALVAAYVQFITPVEGAREAMAEIDPSLVDNQLIFPDEDTLATVSLFRSLSADEETSFSEAFQRVIGN